MLDWIAATVSVLALIFVLARGGRWLLKRSGIGDGPVGQLQSWRVAPDASVRAIRVYGRVHLLYERGKESVLLESIESSQLESRRRASEPTPVDAARRLQKGLKSRVASA